MKAIQWFQKFFNSLNSIKIDRDKIINIGRPKKIIKHHLVCRSKKDKSGRCRYHIYVDGKTCNNDLTITCWYDEKIE